MSTETITVLGKTFSSEEERRDYFREELRKKLPELKKMEGFPIGEDDDIINLSDPPYYTACPNPWLNDFIGEWEEEKKELERLGKRKLKFDVEQPYAADISEGKNNPIYNAHSYHTKVPHPAIMRYMLHYTQPGDIVYDGFGGTGMTGVAGHALANPEPSLHHVLKAEFAGESAEFGYRKVVLGDLSPIASNIAANYNYQPEELHQKLYDFKIFLKSLEKELDWLFQTTVSGVKREINYIVWTQVFQCTSCFGEINFWNDAIQNNTVVDPVTCPHCSVRILKKNLPRVLETVHDSYSDSIKKRPKAEIAFINYVNSSGLSVADPSKFDNEISVRAAKAKIGWLPTDLMMHKGKGWGDLYRAGYHVGIESADDFHFNRSRIIIAKIFEHVRGDKFLTFVMTSTLTNLLRTARYKFGRSGNVPLSGTLYMGSLQVETNPFRSLKNKISAIGKIIPQIQSSHNVIQVASASSSNLPSNSIDYIFTDPPFGGNLPYSELNFVWESWLKVKTNIVEEAIESPSQSKSVFTYQKLMQACFDDYFRVLKPNQWMTVEFSNTSAGIWNAIQYSIQQAGFIIAGVTGLDKKQGSYKAVMSLTAVKQDLVISCYKPASEFDERFRQHQNSDVAVWDFVMEHLKHLPIHLTNGIATTAIIERSPKILFDRLIAFYVQKGLPVPIDAGKFQKGIRERFVERDGMFFTQEQVNVYDKKKIEAPDFVQLSLLVSSEQDGVLWLKNALKDNPMKFRDINPLWMQALAGMRKGDMIPELMTILEEGFLKDGQGRWYAPDPENEIDLEQVRTKRLLKKFDEYRTEAAKPRGKIKEARVEALRAGFKHCYQEKDFKTIVQVGDRIPNNLLMEDEVLLQFYDIASSRV